jgi:hypothetical protein
MSAMWFSYSRHMDAPADMNLTRTVSLRHDWVQFE